MNSNEMFANHPSTWAGFVGQELAVTQLKMAVMRARERRERAAHVLLADGRGGVGKTALAVLYAGQLRRKLVQQPGGMNLGDAHDVLYGMRDGDVLFIDEIHLIRDPGWLLFLLADGVLPGLPGQAGLQPQPDITVVAATTDVGKLPQPVIGRFNLRPPLVPYTDEQAAKIVAKMAPKIFDEGVPLPSKANREALARAACNNPRRIARLLEFLALMAGTGTLVPQGRTYDLRPFFAAQNLTPDGLDATAQRYLLVLSSFGRKPAGERAMADCLEEPGGLRQTELDLFSAGLIGRGPTGRYLTPAGRVRAMELEKAA